MSKFTRLLCTTALGTLLLPHIAAADVTPEDVWQNHLDYIATFGGDFTNTVARNGNTLSVSDAKLAYQLPFGVGSLAISLAGFEMTDNGDGSVAVTYANPATYGVEVEITGKGSFSTNIDFTIDGDDTTATGVLGDVTYTWSADRMAMQLRDFELIQTSPAEDALKEPEINVSGTFADMSGTLRITVGEHVTTQSSVRFGKQNMSLGFTAADAQFNYTAGADGWTQSTQSTLPRNGMDIMNLAAALRDGLTFYVAGQSNGNHTSQTTKIAGKVTDQQSSGSKEQTAAYALDQSGLHAEANITDAYLKMPVSPEIPFPLELHVAKGRVGITWPLLASTALQDAAFDITFEGMTMADDIWALFDPEQILPRDPMDITVDMSAKVLNKLDWLDFLTVKAALDAGKEPPSELHALTLNDLLVTLAGAHLTGSGSGTIDYTDLETFGGFPKPTGVIDLTLSGGNGLLDNLVAMGLLSDEDAIGARMAMAVFTQPDPDAGVDVLKTRLEMTEEGHFLANGQRLQ